MPDMHAYPESVQDILRDDRKYRGAVLKATKAFRHSKAWKGTFEERKAKFQALHDALCAIYGKRLRLIVAEDANTRAAAVSGDSWCDPDDGRLCLTKLSVITYLHEFAHALGKSEKGACIWSVNLFRRVFPYSFARCQFEGHMVLAGSEVAARNAERNAGNAEVACEGCGDIVAVSDSDAEDAESEVLEAEEENAEGDGRN